MALQGSTALRLALALLCASSALSSTTAIAQNPYTVCIGDGCDRHAYVNLGCSFATAHPNDVDEEAAKLICMVKNKYEKYIFVRTHVVKGGRCGAIYLEVRCE